eukprot:1152746-Pelagomonas_calceolata.AAC.4
MRERRRHSTHATPEMHLTVSCELWQQEQHFARAAHHVLVCVQPLQEELILRGKGAGNRSVCVSDAPSVGANEKSTNVYV